MSDELIARINFLANKKKTEGLSEAELEEQTLLRKEYLQEFKAGFKERLMSLKVVDEQGSDVTPEKLKQAKKERKN